MSDREIAREIPTASKAETQKSLYDEVYNFCQETMAQPDARARQAFVVGYGACIGGMKNIQELPKEFINHPWETTEKVAKESIPGFVTGAVLTAASPEIVEAATAAGIVTTAASLWHTCMNLMTDRQLQKSMENVFKSGDQRVMNAGIQVASDRLGPEAARYGIELASTLTGLYGPKIWKDISCSQLENKLRPYWPHTVGTRNGAVEVIFEDGSALHLHDDQAIYSVAGLEFPLHASSAGVYMKILGSLAGRQVVKGWQEADLIQPFADVFTRPTRMPFKVDINPKLGQTKVNSFGKTFIYKHPESGPDDFGQDFSSCGSCDPFNPTNR